MGGLKVGGASRAAIALIAGLATGCVRAYQPLSGVGPVVVDPSRANLPDLRVDLRCDGGRELTRAEAGTLCRKVARVLENQGATVRVDDGGGALTDGDDRLGPPDLTVQITTRDTDRRVNALSWALCAVTFTILPAISEQGFTQAVEIHDQDGFLLLREDMSGRVVVRTGAGPWLGNKLLDLIVRPPEEHLTGDAAERDLSDHVYRQITQMVVNANVQRELLAASRAP